MLLRINPANDKLSFEAASDYIERGRMLVTRLNLDAHNRGDSLVFAASTEDLYLNSFHMSRVGMSGGAKDNKLELITDFADTIGDVSDGSDSVRNLPGDEVLRAGRSICG